MTKERQQAARDAVRKELVRIMKVRYNRKKEESFEARKQFKTDKKHINHILDNEELKKEYGFVTFSYYENEKRITVGLAFPVKDILQIQELVIDKRDIK